MALFSSGMPPVAVYLVKPASSAALAASLMCAGVSKSGSPAAKLTTSSPLAASALALALRDSVGDGLIALRRRLSCTGRSSLLELGGQPLQHVLGDQPADVAVEAG